MKKTPTFPFHVAALVTTALLVAPTVAHACGDGACATESGPMFTALIVMGAAFWAAGRIRKSWSKRARRDARVVVRND